MLPQEQQQPQSDPLFISSVMEIEYLTTLFVSHQKLGEISGACGEYVNGHSVLRRLFL